jgi:hypothetical protein
MLAFARPGREERCSIEGDGALGAPLIGKAAHRSWPGRFSVQASPITSKTSPA